MKISVEYLIKLLQAKYCGNSTEFTVQDVSIDSRSLKNTEGVLFFAIKGKNNDAHIFIEELIQRGVQYFVVQYIPEALREKAHFFVVKDVQKAFQKFAIYYRTLFDIPVIGITGSNGKTIVKEWLNVLLEDKYHIIKSPKSYNSQVGVPISVIGINEHHSLGIFEAGISTTEEMKILGEIIRPTLGLLTNIGTAHDEGFASREEKIKEKLKLFAHAQCVIIPNDREVIEAMQNQSFLTYGNTIESDFFFEKKEENFYRVHYNQHAFEVKYPFADKASVQNIHLCIATMLYFQAKPEEIQQKIPQLTSINMRLQVKNGKNNCTLIDDSYASDYQSLKIAFDFLEQQKIGEKKTVILSDILQSGFEEEILYQKIAQLIHKNNIYKVIGIGEVISKHLSKYVAGAYFTTTQEFLDCYNTDSFVEESILIKGSRVFSFERIVQELEARTHETVLEVNLDNITHNYNYYKSLLKPTTKIMVMIKAFGYGNGSYEIAKQLQHLQVDYLGVAFADEGIHLRKSGINSPIIVMNPEKSAFDQMVHYQLQPEIYSLSVLKDFVKALQKTEQKKYPIHLKINTGMNRLGFVPKDFEQLISFLSQQNEVEVESIFSHLATSDMPEMKEFTNLQLQKFQNAAQQITKKLNHKPILHILNTSGIYYFSEHQHDMVRLGIGLYGVGNSTEEHKNLLNVSQLKTIVMQITTIKEGETVGYGRRYKAKTPTQIATIPIGYADGIRRSYGNGVGEVYIKGKKYPIIGSICMDMLMVDIGKDKIKEGEEVEIFGHNIPIKEVAEKWQTIPYEVMTSISQRVKRIYYKE